MSLARDSRILCAMRVLEIAPLASPIDERRGQLGGAQVLFADLARGLAQRGHAVTLAAAEGSYVSDTTLAPLGLDSGLMRPAQLGATEGAREDDAAQREAFGRVRLWLDTHAGEIDVVHAHAYDAPAFASLIGAPRPVVHTLHLPPLDERVVAAARDAAAAGATLVTVSSTNARAWRDAGVSVEHVIPNGIDLSTAPPEGKRGPHLVCAGRISPEKGVDDALDVARRLGRGIVVVGGVYDAPYFEKRVLPRVRSVPGWRPGDGVDGSIYVGGRARSDVLAILAGGAASVMAIHWDEPFGLVAVESLASGTPVAAYRRGALAEIVDASCGSLAVPDDRGDLARAVEAAVTRRHEACRVRARAYSIEAMIARYETLLREVFEPRTRSG